MTTRRYAVRYERGDDGWWLATVPELPGAHAQGRTVGEARQRIREAIAVFRGIEPDDVVLGAEDVR